MDDKLCCQTGGQTGDTLYSFAVFASEFAQLVFGLFLSSHLTNLHVAKYPGQLQ